MAQKHGHLEKKTLNVYKLLRCGSGASWRKSAGHWTAHVSKEVLSLVNEQRCLVHVIKQRQANWIGHVLRHDCLLSAEDCTRREDGRKTDTRKTKKKDVGPTHGARGQEDQLPGVEEKS